MNLFELWGFPVFPRGVGSRFYQNFDRQQQQQDLEDSKEPFSEDSGPFVDLAD